MNWKNENENETAVPDTLGTIFLNEITRIDCAVFDPSKGILGHSWKVDLTITGPLGDNGFVFDFGSLKTLVRQVLKSSVDHALIIPINSQSVQFKGMASAESWSMKSKTGKSATEHHWNYVGPSGAVFPTRSVVVSRQVLEQEISKSLRHRLPTEITNISVQIRDEELEATEASFRYTHGIAGHEGMCQRLMHGHRCRIQVFIGDERRPDLEHYIARDVMNTNIHFTTPSQFRKGEIPVGCKGKPGETITIGYTGTQGEFEATMPAERVFAVSCETSIECITFEIAKLIKREENTAEKVKVICYEGIDKGAIAEV